MLADPSVCSAWLAIASTPRAGQHRREGEEEGQDGGDECAEDDEQDREGERDRDALGTREVLADGVLERLVGRGGTELLEP